MKIIYRAYRFALLPNKGQRTLLSKHFDCVRYIYNHFLNQDKELYLATEKSDRYCTQARSLVGLKKQEETSWLKEVNSQSLQFAIKCLNTAYCNFFSGRAEAPVFKSRKKKKSFTVPQHVEISEGKLYFPKFKEGIKLIEHRPLSGLLKHCTVSQTRTGKYFVSILCQVMHAPSKPTNKRCGIDLGIADFVVTSDERRFENNHFLENYQKRLYLSEWTCLGQGHQRSKKYS